MTALEQWRRELREGKRRVTDLDELAAAASREQADCEFEVDVRPFKRTGKPIPRHHVEQVDGDNDHETLPPEFSEDALALEFTRRHGHDFRYTAGSSKWFEWDGSTWQSDATLRVFNEIRLVCRDASMRAGEPRVRERLSSAKTVNAVASLARSDRVHVATVDQWDRNPWLLNTPNGAVNLRTGQIRANERGDYCTRRTAVAPGGDCPRWLQFLEEVTGSDGELIGFLRRIAGYCLTGDISEHAMFFLYGTGRNGKGTFINTISRILGGYAVPSPIETFTATHTDRHPTELAMLRGARLVTSQETEEGRRWAEAKIKALTGGDPISARFMRGDFFTYEPQFKLVIAGNHKPTLRSVDEAIVRRFHLVPFVETIPISRRDPQLPDKLRNEWPGILKWMIRGCSEWLDTGLRPPAAVVDATRSYFESEDSFQLWLDECCVLQPTHQASTAELYTAWTQWAERRGERPGSTKAFSEKLQTRRFTKITIGHAKTRGFKGLSVRSNDVQERCAG